MNRMKYLVIILIFCFGSCSLSKQIFGSIGSKNPIQLAIANFLARYSKPSPSCIKVATKIQSTNQTTGEKNTITCKFDYGTISNLCSYEKPISESNIEVSQKRTYYQSVEDFIKQKEIFVKNFQTFEIYNEDKTKKKQLYYDNDKRIRILEPDGGEFIYTEFDSNNRPIKGKSNSHCEVPIEFSYDDQNYSLNVNIYYSQTGPESNNYCVFYRSLPSLQNQNYKLEFDKDFFKLKDTITVGNTVTVINYSNLETEQVCTGNSGTVFTENLEPVEVSSIETENTLAGAAAGEFITLRGKNFNPNFASNQVQFHDKISVIPVSGDATFIRVQIPQNARSGRILVDNGKAKSFSPNFIVYKYYLYVANYTATNNLLRYNFDTQTGVITPFTNVAISVGNQPRGLAVTPDGKYLFISRDNPNANEIDSRSIFFNSGEFGTINPAFGDDGKPHDLGIDSSGKYLFISYQNAGTRKNQIRSLNSDSTTTALSDYPIDPQTTNEFVFHPTKLIYYATSISDTKVYGVNFLSGMLTAISGSPLPTTNTPNYSAIHPSGNYLYIATSGGTAGIQLYSINPTNGSLNLINTYSNITSGHLGIAIDNKGKFLVTVSDGNDTIKSFQIESDFSLTAKTNIGLTNPKKVIFDPSGKFVYVLTAAPGISYYSLNQDGTLSFINSISGVPLNSTENLIFAKIPQ